MPVIKARKYSDKFANAIETIVFFIALKNKFTYHNKD